MKTPPQKAALDEEELFALISKHNTGNPDRFYNPKAMAEDRQLAIDICERFGTPQRAVVGVEYIMDIISKIEMEHKLKVYDMRDAKVIAKAIHEALIQDKK